MRDRSNHGTLLRQREMWCRRKGHDADDAGGTARRLKWSVRARHRVKTAIDAPHGAKADYDEN